MSEKWTIYYNPGCTKCRSTMALLEEKGVKPDIIEYLQEPPSVERLTELIKKLGVPARDLVRTKEEEFKSVKVDLADSNAVIAMLVKHPRLLERPIVVKGDRAVIARPPENVLKLF